VDATLLPGRLPTRERPLEMAPRIVFWTLVGGGAVAVTAFALRYYLKTKPRQNALEAKLSLDVKPETEVAVVKETQAPIPEAEATLEPKQEVVQEANPEALLEALKPEAGEDVFDVVDKIKSLENSIKQGRSARETKSEATAKPETKEEAIQVLGSILGPKIKATPEAESEAKRETTPEDKLEAMPELIPKIALRVENSARNGVDDIDANNDVTSDVNNDANNGFSYSSRMMRTRTISSTPPTPPPTPAAPSRGEEVAPLFFDPSMESIRAAISAVAPLEDADDADDDTLTDPFDVKIDAIPKVKSSTEILPPIDEEAESTVRYDVLVVPLATSEELDDSLDDSPNVKADASQDASLRSPFLRRRDRRDTEELRLSVGEVLEDVEESPMDSIEVLSETSSPALASIQDYSFLMDAEESTNTALWVSTTSVNEDARNADDVTGAAPLVIDDLSHLQLEGISFQDMLTDISSNEAIADDEEKDDLGLVEELLLDDQFYGGPSDPITFTEFVYDPASAVMDADEFDQHVAIGFRDEVIIDSETLPEELMLQPDAIMAAKHENAMKVSEAESEASLEVEAAHPQARCVRKRQNDTQDN